MSEMVERVARAIHNACEPWDAFEIDRSEWLAAARVAIAAMREPTTDMAYAGATAMMAAGDDRQGRMEAMAAFRAMIDAALAEDGK